MRSNQLPFYHDETDTAISVMEDWVRASDNLIQAHIVPCGPTLWLYLWCL